MKHKYIFYFFATEEQKSQFLIVERVKEGKEIAKKRKCNYDYKKIY